MRYHFAHQYGIENESHHLQLQAGSTVANVCAMIMHKHRFSPRTSRLVVCKECHFTHDGAVTDANQLDTEAPLHRYDCLVVKRMARVVTARTRAI